MKNTVNILCVSSTNIPGDSVNIEIFKNGIEQDPSERFRKIEYQDLTKKEKKVYDDFINLFCVECYKEKEVIENNEQPENNAEN